MNPVVANINIQSLLSNKGTSVDSASLTGDGEQLSEFNGVFSDVLGLKLPSSLSEQLRTLLPQDISSELESLPEDVLQQLQALLEDGNGLPQAAEITPVIEAATASMEAAVSALEDAAEQLDQAAPADQILASMLVASLALEQQTPAKSDGTSTAQQITNATEASGWSKLLQQQTLFNQQQPAVSMENVGSDSKESVNSASATLSLLQKQMNQSLGQQTSERLSLVAEKMKAVGEATPQLAQEVKSLSQLLGPTMRLVTQDSSALSRSSTAITESQMGGFVGTLNQVTDSAASQRSTAPSLTMDYQSKGWDQALGDRVMWMVGRNIQQASLRITPQHLGPIEIQISMQDDVAKVNFITHSGAVKEALEAAIPRLREMCADNQMQLANVDVGQRNAQDQRGLAQGSTDQQSGSSSDGGFPGAASQSDIDGNEAIEESVARVATALGLVDDYA